MKATPQVAKGYAAFERRQDLVDQARRIGMKLHLDAAQAVLDFQSNDKLQGKKVIYRLIAVTGDGRRICIEEYESLADAVRDAKAYKGKAPAIGARFQWNHPQYGYDLQTETDEIIFF